jgi:hypothetical protein
MVMTQKISTKGTVTIRMERIALITTKSAEERVVAFRMSASSARLVDSLLDL